MTFCRRGHELTGDNAFTRFSHGRPFTACRICTNEAHRRYHATAKGRARSRVAGQSRPKGQQYAHLAIQRRIRRGDIVPESCKVCGDPATEAHHPRGYAPAHRFDIEWLCHLHHSRAHRVAA